MDKISYGNNRWELVYGSYQGVEALAAERVYGAVSPFVPYILTAVKDHQANIESINPILLGTPDSNLYIKDMVQKGFIAFPNHKEGFAVQVCKSIFSEEKQMIVLAAKEEKSLLYAVVDFINFYLPTAHHTHDHDRYFRKLFQEEMPMFQLSKSPKINHRAVWTWGHVIYDYKKFIENMVSLKMNMIVIWNDHPPVNGKEIVEYAHLRGIQVIWGFSWGWGEDIDITNPEEIKNWSDRILKVYEESYGPLKGDGIYFQTFTETNESTLNGMIIAEAVVQWVNGISQGLLEKHPELLIQFGLHATSVKNELKYIKGIDPRIQIVWEDCGAFPYAYSPKKIEGFKETRELTEKISKLRGDEDHFGVVLKGFCCLNWPTFEHQKGPFLLGCEEKSFLENRMREKTPLWKYIQGYWLENANYAKEMIEDIAHYKKGEATVQVLIEDGMLEEKVWYPALLYSELLWESEAGINEIMRKVALAPNVEFA